MIMWLFLDPEGSLSATTVVLLLVLVVTVFEKCLRLCKYETESYET